MSKSRTWTETRLWTLTAHMRNKNDSLNCKQRQGLLLDRPQMRDVLLLADVFEILRKKASIEYYRKVYAL